MSADFIFINGEVLTVNPRDEIVQAVAVRGNRIVAVGNSEDILALRGPETKVIDLGGRALLPGFIDAHMHMALYGTNKLGIDCKNGVRSVQDIVNRLYERAQSIPEGEWIRGWGYNDMKLKENRHPTRWDLDQASTAHPIIVTRGCVHISAANSKALELLGITRDTPDPVGGKIERDENGEPTGVLKEKAHMWAFYAAKYSPEEIIQALVAADLELRSLGITSVHDAGAYGPAQLRAGYQAVSQGKVKIRINAMIYSLIDESEKFISKVVAAGLATGLGNERFKIGPVKIIIDGSSSGPTAGTRRPYTSNSLDSGILYYTQEEIDAILLPAHKAGFQITAHAVGDQAVEMMINAIERALQEYPRANHRHRIEHAGMVPSDLMTRIKKLGIVPMPNPAFFYDYGEGYIKNYGERVDFMFPLADYVQEGIVAPSGSDAPVTYPNPLVGIYCALTRKTQAGVTVGECQKVSLLQAIRSFTWSGAYASFEEDKKGSLEVGKLADLIILSDSLLSTEPEEILKLKPVFTMIDGEVVFEQE